jgi:hypothetical protein
MSKQKYAQPILFFFCRPCGEYHEKTHPHVRGEGFGCRGDQILKLESGQSKSSPPKILEIMPL